MKFRYKKPYYLSFFYSLFSDVFRFTSRSMNCRQIVLRSEDLKITLFDRCTGRQFKMSQNFIERFCHRHFQKNPKKSKEEIIKTLTHLYLNGRKLDEIKQFTCEQLRVLYLHNNCIRQIKHLDDLKQLTHLYLQWNQIEKMENLNHLKHLRKLYLSYNRIQRMKGIEQLRQLEELHLEQQDLGTNKFTFDFNSLRGVSASLRVLNISGLSLTDLDFLPNLPNLVELIAINNCFDDTDQITSSIGELHALHKAQFNG